MKREEIISGIKQAEGNATSIVESARAASELRMGEAKREAGRIVEQARAEAGERGNAAFAKAVSEVRAECDSTLQAGTNELELYRERARKNIEKAKELLLERFEAVFHA